MPSFAEIKEKVIDYLGGNGNSRDSFQVSAGSRWVTLQKFNHGTFSLDFRANGSCNLIIDVRSVGEKSKQILEDVATLHNVKKLIESLTNEQTPQHN